VSSARDAVRVLVVHPRDPASPTLGGIQTFLRDFIKYAPADFEITFVLGADTLSRCWEDGDAFSDAILAAFLTILAAVPDTLIARKNGKAAAEDVSRRAARVLSSGGSVSERGRAGLCELARELGDEAHTFNPGTTADFVAASLFVFLTEGGMLADVIPVIASIDPIMGDVDR